MGPVLIMSLCVGLERYYLDIDFATGTPVAK